MQNILKNKKIIAILSVVLCALIVVITLATIHIQHNNSADYQLSLGEKYLTELNYEEAILSFNKVIKIDPANVDAYLGMAEAYIGLGDTDSALDILMRGYEETGDQRLMDKYNEISSVEEVPELPEVTEVTTVQPTNEFITIKGKQYSTSLTELHLDSMSLNDNDIKELSKMKNLKYLSLWHNKNITDISPLVGLSNLTELYLGDNNIVDINPLAKLKSLKKLCFGGQIFGHSYDISPLAELTNLTELELLNDTADISPLENLTNITCLKISAGITDISPLAKLINLTKLELSFNNIIDFNPLTELVNLTELRINNNNYPYQIADISPLTKLINLTYLDLSNNQITDISSLTNLTNLEYLYFDWYILSEEETAILKKALPNCDMGDWWNNDY